MSDGMGIMALQAILLLPAWCWHGGSDRLVMWLSLAFVTSVWLGTSLTGIDMHIALALLDAAIVTAASKAWIDRYDMRGWWIGLIGLSKIGGRLAYLTSGHVIEPYVSFWVFAAAMNVAFAAQVIIAGGILDELGRRIADYLRGAGPLRARLLRNVAGK